MEAITNSRDTLLSQRSYDARSSMVRDGFAMGWVLGILLDSNVVCGRLKIFIEWWYNHLLVCILVLLPYPCYHLLVYLRPARSIASLRLCARFTYTRVLTSRLTIRTLY